MPDAGWREALWPEPAQVLARVGMTPSMSVVDLCAGDGWFTRQIAKSAKHVTAIDFDDALLVASRERLAESGIANVTFIVSDAYEIGSAVREPVDFVFLANTFHGVPDRPKLARCIRGVLKPNGLFVVVNWHARSRDETKVLGKPRGPETKLRLSPETTIAEVNVAGLSHMRTVEVSPHHYGVVFLNI